MGQRYFLNGQAHLGWRIEDRLSELTGAKFLQGAVAFVPKLENAELIVQLLNNHDEAQKRSKAWDDAHEAAE